MRLLRRAQNALKNRQTEGRYTGPVCFGDGWYHPVLLDEYNNELGPDFSRKLVWTEGSDGGYWEFARPHHASHFHAYGKVEVVLEPGPGE